MRMYAGAVLSDQEMRRLAMAETPAGRMRECLLAGEAQDAGWRPANGLDCSWYQRAKLKNVVRGCVLCVRAVARQRGGVAPHAWLAMRLGSARFS
eukprot:1916564-Rhodomonas_salina.2